MNGLARNGSVRNTVCMRKGVREHTCLGCNLQRNYLSRIAISGLNGLSDQSIANGEGRNMGGWRSLYAVPMMAAAALVTVMAPVAAQAGCTLKKIAELPVVMRGGRGMVSVKINGQENLMALDSGAFYSVIDPAKANELKLSDCNAAVNMSAKTTNALNGRGFVHYLRGEDADAISDFNASLSRNSKSGWALFGRSLVEKRRGDQDAARADREAAIAAYPPILEEARRFGLEH